MIALSLKDSGELVGTIEESDLQKLQDVLEEESAEDTDYYVDGATIDLLLENGASEHLITVLKEAVGDSEGVDIVWAEE